MCPWLFRGSSCLDYKQFTLILPLAVTTIGVVLGVAINEEDVYSYPCWPMVSLLLSERVHLYVCLRVKCNCCSRKTEIHVHLICFIRTAQSHCRWTNASLFNCSVSLGCEDCKHCCNKHNKVRRHFAPRHIAPKDKMPQDKMPQGHFAPTCVKIVDILPQDILPQLFFCIFLWHILCISWAYLVAISGISCAYLGHILGISWTYLRHILGISEAYLGHISGISRAYLGHILDISLAYLERILGIFCCGITFAALPVITS